MKEKEQLTGVIKELNAGMGKMMINTFLETSMDTVLNFNEKTLIKIEEKINEMYPPGHQPLVTTLIPFGWFFGECIKAIFPKAKWSCKDDDSGLFDMCIKLKQSKKDKTNGFECYPFQRIDKFWKNRENRMSTFIRTMEFSNEIQMNKEYWEKRSDSEGWITFANGDMIRITHLEQTNA